MTQTRSHSNRVGYLARGVRHYYPCMYWNTYIVFLKKNKGAQPRAVM